jgi:SAM-dependent methyltransferase
MQPKLYGQLSSWWPLLSPPADYVEEAEFYTSQLMTAGTQPAGTLLELGSGGGNNASHMKKTFRMTLVDPSPGMLEISRRLNPECDHVQGDMRTMRLGRQFDRVFIHDAIAYMATVSDLQKAIETAFLHCRTGGAALFAPDHLRETFRSGTDCGGHDGEDRALRYLEWTWDPNPDDTTYTVDYAYLLREKNGEVRVEHDRHIEGLFGRDQWLGLLAEAGFQAKSVPFDHSELEPGSYEVFVAVK